MLARMIDLAERAPASDALTRAGISALVALAALRLRRADDAREARFVEDMRALPIALHTAAANAQHYELPASFFETVLGPRQKYSCCLFETPGASLEDAEDAALKATVARAGLADGMRVLDLGCGWGSLSLYAAERFSRMKITAVSNSRAQRDAIVARARRLGLYNIEVVAADMNRFAPVEKFDRIVSVEMFEHMANWDALLARCRSWLRADGRLFLHVFAHANAAYRFDHDDPADWIARHFFTGGLMPSRALPRRFPHSFSVEREWRWSGAHYAQTARRWLANFDAGAERVEAILRPVHGVRTDLAMRRWRLFFLAVEGMFGHARGEVWDVGHYLMAPRATGDEAASS